MKKALSVVAAGALLLQLYTPVSAASERVIYVSPNGSFDAAGTSTNPVDSLKAVNELLKNSNDEAVRVVFKKGVYNFEDTTVLNNKSNITYTTDGLGEVIFTGAKELSADKFYSVDDADILKRLPSEARSKVLAYDLSESGLSYSTNDSVRPYLYVDNILKTTARYPNDKHLKADKANGAKSFSVDDEHAAGWSTAEDAVLAGSLEATYFWRNYDMTVSESVITASGNVRKNAEYYVENLIEELDAPGEYFVDRTANMLYYYPETDLTGADIQITAFLKDGISVKGSSNIVFDGITFDKIGGCALNIENSENVKIQNCNFYYVQGSNTIYLSGKNSAISDNLFYGCANNVIEFHGGSMVGMVNGNIEVKNNRISYCGYRGKNSIISSGSSATSSPRDLGNSITNNLIQDCMTFMSISVNANDYTINYNEILNQGYLIGDGGAIYMGKSNVKYGTEVAYNYIHDGHKSDPAYAYCGVYSDDGYSGTNFHHNVIKDMYQGFILGLGMNCKINHNLLINNSNASGVGSRMTTYSAANGATESGMQDTMYNEAYSILNNTTYKEEFKEHYPQIAEGMKRTPYFAPWYSEITGNVAIGGKSVEGRPWHPYYKKDGTTPVIDGEAEVVKSKSYSVPSGSHYIGSNKYEGAYIDEIALYAANIVDRNGNDLNCTAAGNPKFDYDEKYFVDAENQNFTLTDSFISEVSTVNEINMNKIGIASSINENIFTPISKGLELTAPQNSEQNTAKKTVFAWNRYQNASKYSIVVSEKSNLTDAVVDETFNDTSDALMKEYELENGKKYYWRVTAYGIAKDNSFMVSSDIQSFTVRNADYISNANLKKVTEIAEKYLDNYSKEYYKFTDETIPGKISTALEAGKASLQTGTTQGEFDTAEAGLLDVLSNANECLVVNKLEITECTVDQKSDDVKVTVAGFEPHTIASVLVTNPNKDLKSADESFDLSSVQYTDTLKADANGIVAFTFNTRVENEDRSGNYTVYVSDYKGRNVEKTYNYGILTIGAISYKTESGEKVEDITAITGKTVIMSCDIENNTSKKINPSIITAFYKNGTTLSKVFANEENVIGQNEKKAAEWKITVPESLTDITQIKVMFVESMGTLKPLTKFRVIFESK